MVQLIVGNKGKGKTKIVLEKVNEAVKEAKGNLVYLDKSSKHMYDLNNRIRLINVSDFPLTNADEFIGFICGIISQDHDLEQMYLDNFRVLSKTEEDDARMYNAIDQLDAISNKFQVDFIISTSIDSETIDPAYAEKVIVSL